VAALRVSTVDKTGEQGCDGSWGTLGNVGLMFRLGIAVSLIALVLLAACGGGNDNGGGSSSSSSASGGSSNASAQGKTVFNTSCKGCHTLKDAGATGTVGPNLDDLQPDKATVVRQVNNGGGPMPAFKGKLSSGQINAVSTYVSSVAGKGS
jgi:mono/diheme cytochrome c family protein